VLIRNRLVPVVAVVTGVTLAACGGGGHHSYKAGTPAVTGVAPNCSVVPLDLVKKTLDNKATGPVSEPKPDGTTCTFGFPTGSSVLATVQLTGHVDTDSFNVLRDGLKASNNPVNKIKGWGDEAYAAATHRFETTNIFAVRKGQVSVVITSTADFDHIKKLMKELLAKM
jgi:hypothetical protein